MSKYQKRSFKISTEIAAEDFWKEDPEGALAGGRLASVETGMNAGPERNNVGRGNLRTAMVMNLAAEQPGRFRELVSKLSPMLRDIFFQYYILNRTQVQIGRTLGCGQKNVDYWLKKGIGQLCSVIAYGVAGEDSGVGGRKVRLKSPRTLGAFEIRTDDTELKSYFAPRMNR